MKKIGRNELCPCGSGKKYKHCHIGREDELVLDDTNEISYEMSSRITSLSLVEYGRSQEMIDALDIEELTGISAGIRFIDQKEYNDLNISGHHLTRSGKEGTGGVLVNVLKTRKSDPDNIYVAISSGIGDSILVHQLAHVFDYLGGSRLIPGMARPLSLDLMIPVEHLEHPLEFGYWLEYLRKKFNVQLDADDTIIAYLYDNEMLIKGGGNRKTGPFHIEIKSRSNFEIHK